MEKIKKIFAHKIFRIFMWVFFVLLGLYIILVIVRVVQLFNVDKTNAQVEKIHNTKLTMDDVLGANLPPDPGIEADKTIEGIDSNKNGIRDDVEIAIFKEYPNSAKTRAVLLQYALALQMQMTLPLINTETVTATVENKSASLVCIWSITSREDLKKFKEITAKNEELINSKQFNTEERIKYKEDFYKKLGSYSMSEKGCDLDLSTLIN